MTKFICPGRAGQVFRHDPLLPLEWAWSVTPAFAIGLLKLNPDGKELEVTEVLNKIVDSIEAELSANALALEAF